MEKGGGAMKPQRTERLACKTVGPFGFGVGVVEKWGAVSKGHGAEKVVQVFRWKFDGERPFFILSPVP